MNAPPLRRGDIWWVDWSPGRGSEELGHRPALVIQNDVGNQYAPTTIIAAITTGTARAYPFIVGIAATESGLTRDGYVNLSQILTVDRSRLARKAGRLNRRGMSVVDTAIKVSLGLE